MNCETAQSFIHAYLDAELPAAEQLTIEQHLESCATCLELRGRVQALRSAIRTQAPRYSAPAELRERIRADVRRAESPRPVPKPDRRWAAIAAATLIAIASVWGLRSLSSRSGSDLIAEEIVSSHVRSLMANHLVDEPSTDQHTVKPWFAGKLDFSPPVKNLDTQGFVLAGGRLDYQNRRPVAALVYRRRQHVINLFIWPTESNTGERTTSLQGYNVIHWSNSGMTYWAVSDLNKQELQLFSRLVQQ